MNFFFFCQKVLQKVLFWFFLWNLMACQSLSLSGKDPFKKEAIPVGKTEVSQTEVDFKVQKELKPDFLKVKPPRLGLILGAGGALSFAHVGVLQELERQKIPVHAIVGLEWGSLVAGAYALKNKAHAIEWKLLKLPVEKFEGKSFFKKSQRAIRVSQMDSFLDDLFSENYFGALKIPFACPFGDLKQEKIKLKSHGSLKDGIKVCWPHPPHFIVEEVGGVLNAVPKAARFLRARGADIVVYVDLCSSNELLSKEGHGQNSMISLMWIQHKALVEEMPFHLVDDVIKLSLSGNHINSYKSLRALVRTGQIKSRLQIKELSKKYPY